MLLAPEHGQRETTREIVTSNAHKMKVFLFAFTQIAYCPLGLFFHHVDDRRASTYIYFQHFHLYIYRGTGSEPLDF